MRIISVFYAAFGYLMLLVAILWGMLFLGDGVDGPLMDAPATATPFAAILVDLGLLLPLVFLHQCMSRGMLRHITHRSIPRGVGRSSQAWAYALALILIYVGWRPVPQYLWGAAGSLQWVFSGFFYVAWTLILMGTFLPGHAPGKGALTGTLCQPLYGGILMAVWTTSMMTVGHLLLASTVTAYLLFDGISEARRSVVRESRAGACSFQGQRVAGQRMILAQRRGE